MARPPSTQPTDGELEIFKVLWEVGPAGLGRVHEALQSRRAVAMTTVATMLKMMLAKDLVVRSATPPAPRITWTNSACGPSARTSTPRGSSGRWRGSRSTSAPGEKVRYSNTNYVLLGMVIERVSGKPWEVFLAERIFEPLGMTSTRRYDPAEMVPNRAAPYVERGGRMRNTGPLNSTLWFNADGGLISTVLDLAKWDAALGTEKLLKKGGLEQMWTPAKLGDGKAAVIGDDGAGKPNHYGLGWYLSEYLGHRTILHGGDKPGFSAAFIRFVDDELTVIVLCNRQAGNSAFGMALAFADVFLPNPGRAEGAAGHASPARVIGPRDPGPRCLGG